MSRANNGESYLPNAKRREHFPAIGIELNARDVNAVRLGRRADGLQNDVLWVSFISLYAGEKSIGIMSGISSTAHDDDKAGKIWPYGKGLA